MKFVGKRMGGPDEEGNDRQAQSQRRAVTESTPLLEWIAAGCGLILLSAVLSFLLFDALAQRNLPPEVAIEVLSITRASAVYRVAFKVVNRGGETAQGVIIDGKLLSAGSTIEASWVALDYLAGGAEKQAALFFTQDPHRFELAIRALGYQTP